MQDLAALTGADVAASSDLTGAAVAGGNWALERTTGAIEAQLAPSTTAQQQWQGTMALIGSDSFTNNGDLNGQGGGTGWSNSWSNGSSQFQVVGGGLSDPSGLLPASGGAVQLTVSGNLSTASAVRNLSTTVGADGTSTWISFLVQPNRVGFADYAGVEFGSTSATVGFAGYNGSNFILGVAGSVSPATVSGITPVAGTTYLLVVQITHAAGNDAITLYVNPTPGQAMPTSTYTASASMDLGSFTRIALSGGNGFGVNNAKLDEISIGQTFADVASSVAVNAAPVLTTTGTPLAYSENQAATRDRRRLDRDRRRQHQPDRRHRRYLGQLRQRPGRPGLYEPARHQRQLERRLPAC